MALGFLQRRTARRAFFQGVGAGQQRRATNRVSWFFKKGREMGTSPLYVGWKAKEMFPLAMDDFEKLEEEEQEKFLALEEADAANEDDADEDDADDDEANDDPAEYDGVDDSLDLDDEANDDPAEYDGFDEDDDADEDEE